MIVVMKNATATPQRRARLHRTTLTELIRYHAGCVRCSHNVFLRKDKTKSKSPHVRIANVKNHDTKTSCWNGNNETKIAKSTTRRTKQTTIETKAISTNNEDLLFIPHFWSNLCFFRATTAPSMQFVFPSGQKLSAHKSVEGTLAYSTLQIYIYTMGHKNESPDSSVSSSLIPVVSTDICCVAGGLSVGL